MSNLDFTELECDALKELMNIGFGTAASDLSEIINMLVHISVPDLKILRSDEFKAYLEYKMQNISSVDIIEQSFWGNLSGTGFLFFTDQAPEQISKAILQEHEISSSDEEIGHQLIEIANLVISSCISKLAAQLKDSVCFSPPGIFVRGAQTLPVNFFNHEMNYIVLSANFSLATGEVSGFLFLACEEESMLWIKNAIAKFLSSFK